MQVKKACFVYKAIPTQSGDPMLLTVCCTYPGRSRKGTWHSQLPRVASIGNRAAPLLSIAIQVCACTLKMTVFQTHLIECLLYSGHAVQS